jgi:ferredoxin
MMARRFVASIRIAGQQMFPGRISNTNHSHMTTKSIFRMLNINIKVPYERDTVTISAKPGQTIKDLVDENERLRQYLECACDGNAACSTCHVIVDPDFYDKLDPPEQAELDISSYSMINVTAWY